MAAEKEEKEKACAAYKHGPPWVFKGSALCQLHLVKASTARAFVPRDLRLVEAFGYTLGGMFLARYHDSPAGEFDELVVIAGIVWNPPTSCAWAARVLVNSVEACRHGRKEVGLPSHVATFSSKNEAASLGDRPLAKPNSFLNMLGIGSTASRQGNGREIEVSEPKGSSTRHLCNISLPLTATAGSHKDHKWMGRAIRMSLPSFSGRTEDHPDLLKYSCQVECRVRPVKPARIWSPRTTEPEQKSDGKINSSASSVVADLDAQGHSISVLLSRPIFALEFSSLRMHVDAPKTVVPHRKKKEGGYSST